MAGLTSYPSTRRPIANQHQTRRDIYNAYWKSHYKPAIFQATAYVIYSALARQRGANSRRPMALVCLAALAWIITPVVFSPSRAHVLLSDGGRSAASSEALLAASWP